MLEVADRIKIWAMAAAIGGTIDPMRVIESNFMGGNLSPAIKQLTAVFVLGAVIGSVVYNSVFHSSFDMLWASNQDLELRIQQYEDDIKTLKKYNNQQTVIKEIKIRAEQRDPPLDPVIVKEVIRKLGEDLEVLRGRNIFDIDEDSKIARNLLNRKIYRVRDKEYSIEIKTMLVAEGVLQIWIDIEPQSVASVGKS
ncbi:hypothetical protein BGX30_012120 [Mortierella sp. GBA39]|nr:hypothetical protein BGX30_012120 [Mortierella sp. GBA39]